MKQDEEAQAAQDATRLHNAQAEEQESLPELHKTQAELAGTKAANLNDLNNSKLDLQREKEDRQKSEGKSKYAAGLREHGFKEDEKGNIVPLAYEEMSETQQAVHDLQGSRKELADANAEYAKAKAANAPALLDLAKRRIDNANHTASIAERRLGLSENQFEMRAHGTQGGEALPGAILGDDNKPVGTAFQGNVRPTATQRDAAGRAQTGEELEARIRKALNNPELAKGTGPLEGRLKELQGRLGTLPTDLSELRNDLVSYGAFQAGMHPVRGIGALQYFDKVMGGLGQDPSELIGKLNSNHATAESVKKVGSPKTVGSDTAAHQQTSAPVDPYVKAYADQYFGGDVNKAHAAIDSQKKK